MFDSDLTLTFLFMALLFLRQVSILKQPNKINYAPLMIGVGVISSVIHFIIHPEVTDTILLFRESFFPLLMALFFYIVMNILHQTQQTESARNKDEFSHALAFELTELKEFMADLEGRISASQQEDIKVQNDVREKFKQDIKALEGIKINQNKFFDKFEETENWHKNVSKEFDQFKTVQLPGLDNVIHKHIDILRVAEQEHYNQIKSTLEKAVEGRCNIVDEIDNLKITLNDMSSISVDIADTITKHTLQKLAGVTQAFGSQIVSLKSHTEGIRTSLYEGENRLKSIREQSELILNQMVLSSRKMSELEKQNQGLHDIYATVNELMRDMERIKADYVKSQSQLSVIAREMKVAEAEQIEGLKKQIDTLGEALTQKIDDSLEKLHEHYHITSDDITKSVQMLSKKAQLQKGYTQYDTKET